MATKKKYYKLSERQTKKSGVKRYITIDDSVIPTAQDQKDIEMYVKSGYIIRHKSEERSKKAKERAEKTGFGKKKKETAENK